MRLWHRELVPVLPKEMLVSQWRECIAIKRQWEKGTLKHRLVSYVMEHDRRCFETYVMTVVISLIMRDIKFQEKYWFEILDFCKTSKAPYNIDPYPEHNDRYLRQCYYNLQEKYDRGIVSKEEWELIHKNIYGLIKE